jgi:hypothetical protein
MTRPRYYGDRPTFGGMMMQYLLVFVFCFAFPGAVTMMVPATWLTFNRSGEVVSCKARTCVFFVVPFKTQVVEQVTGIESRERAGRTESQREFGKTTSKNVHVDGQGFLQIHGVGETKAEVSVSPVSLKSVERKSNDFLNSNEQGSTTIFAIANWKFGGLMGGALSLLTLLCVVGYSLSILNFIFKSIKKTLIPK